MGKHGSARVTAAGSCATSWGTLSYEGKDEWAEQEGKAGQKVKWHLSGPCTRRVHYLVNYLRISLCCKLPRQPGEKRSLLPITVQTLGSLVLASPSRQFDWHNSAGCLTKWRANDAVNTGARPEACVVNEWTAVTSANQPRMHLIKTQLLFGVCRLNVDQYLRMKLISIDVSTMLGTAFALSTPKILYPHSANNCRPVDMPLSTWKPHFVLGSCVYLIRRWDRFTLQLKGLHYWTSLFCRWQLSASFAWNTYCTVKMDLLFDLSLSSYGTTLSVVLISAGTYWWTDIA